MFKAVATGERDTNSTNALIDCAKVVVTHQPYVVTGVTLDTTSMTLGVGDSQADLVYGGARLRDHR